MLSETLEPEENSRISKIPGEALQQLSEWKGLLAQNVPIARQILARIRPHGDLPGASVA